MSPSSAAKMAPNRQQSVCRETPNLAQGRHYVRNEATLPTAVRQLSGQAEVEQVAQVLVNQCNTLLIACGAGMGKDAGLPTYEEYGDQPLEKYGYDYASLCSPAVRNKDYKAFTTFWNDCKSLYENTKPHSGYEVLEGWLGGLVEQTSEVGGGGPTTASCAAAGGEKFSSDVEMEDASRTTTRSSAVRATSTSTTRPRTRSRGWSNNFTSGGSSSSSSGGGASTQVRHKSAKRGGAGSSSVVGKVAAAGSVAGGKSKSKSRTKSPETTGRRLCQEMKLNIPSWYVYTSNVDGHFRRFPRLGKHLAEIHGCCEEKKWQSFSIKGRPLQYSQTQIARCSEDEEDGNGTGSSMDASCSEGRQLPDHGSSPTGQRPWMNSIVYKDGRCAGAQPRGNVLLRPKVLLFKDDDDDLLHILAEEAHNPYQKWEDDMEKEKTTRLVILEIGCGKRVPTVREECRDVYEDFNQFFQHKGRRERPPATYVRINPGMDEPEDGVILLNHAGAKDVLHQVDAAVKKLLAARPAHQRPGDGAVGNEMLAMQEDDSSSSGSVSVARSAKEPAKAEASRKRAR